MSYKRITIPMSEEEQKVLRAAASKACRRPHDHARYILLKALGLLKEEDIPGEEITSGEKPE